jgi:ribosome biogenesis GTPase
MLAEKCRFRDCRHQGEPGCAVAAAVQAGNLPSSRIESLHKLEREVAASQARKNGTAARVEKQRWRAIDKEKRRLQRRSYGKIEND